MFTPGDKSMDRCDLSRHKRRMNGPTDNMALGGTEKLVTSKSSGITENTRKRGRKFKTKADVERFEG
jgi:hypothetical protein